MLGISDEALSYKIMDIIDEYDGALEHEGYLAANKNVCEDIKKLLEEAVLHELKDFKRVDCFNEAYTTDARPAKHVDMRIKELESKQ